ncbi:MAG: NAD(P)H-dependent oxidoreductase [Candidatus Poribacteria bacterium]|nr:NAD(P)H-dependent oxidoreductase [Candidatus Poribacteria bacterium]
MAAEKEIQIRVVGLCGSIRSGSYTRRVVNLALSGATEVGAQTELIDLREYQLMFCGEIEEEADYPPDVSKLCQKVQGAQGIILGTPEYHGSFSGVIKNAIDLMGFDEFSGKMVGLVGVSGGSMGALNALSALRTVGRQLHAWVVPSQATVPQASEAFDDDGNLLDKRLEKRITDVGREVARFAYLHSSQKVQEFLHLWEDAPHNPGGE